MKTYSSQKLQWAILQQLYQKGYNFCFHCYMNGSTWRYKESASFAASSCARIWPYVHMKVLALSFIPTEASTHSQSTETTNHVTFEMLTAMLLGMWCCVTGCAGPNSLKKHGDLILMAQQSKRAAEALCSLWTQGCTHPTTLEFINSFSCPFTNNCCRGKAWSKQKSE